VDAAVTAVAVSPKAVPVARFSTIAIGLSEVGKGETNKLVATAVGGSPAVATGGAAEARLQADNASPMDIMAIKPAIVRMHIPLSQFTSGGARKQNREDC